MAEVMNSRERVLAAIGRQPIDRVPTDLWATQEVMDKLYEHFGADADLYSALKIDGILNFGEAKYVGPALADMPDGESVNYWGGRYKKIAHETGCYEEQSYCPLADAETIDDLRAFQWPKVEWFDFEYLKEEVKKVKDRHVVIVGYMAPLYYHGMLRGLEKTLMDPLLDAEFTHYLLDKLTEHFLGYCRKMFQVCEGMVDLTQVTDDFGMQDGPIMSLEIFREFYKPRMIKLIAMAKGFGIKIFHHDDGAMREFLPDLVEMGIDVLNPVQWPCRGMELEPLKRDFGKNICFHGGVDNQKILPFGTPEEVRAEVRHNIDSLASDKTGYILAPCHNLQSVTPLENIIAMYDEAHNYGKL